MELSQKRPDLRAKLLSIAQQRYVDHPAILNPDASGRIEPDRLFSKDSTFHVLELGAGFGELCTHYLKEHPDHDYTAFEIKWDRIRVILKRAGSAPGLRIVPVDFDWFFESMLPARSFDRVIIFFPDPWPKRRHWKHRLIQPDFPERLRGLLRPGADVYLATDYSPYARRMLRIFRDSAFRPLYPYPHFVRENPFAVTTHFEKIKSERQKPFFMAWKNE